MTPLLENYYWTMVMQHAPSGFVARIPLLVMLYLVATGNVTPGRRFLTIVFAAHFAMSSLMAVTVGGEVRIVALVSFALFVACAWFAWREETAWKILPDGGILRALVIAGYTIAFVYPFWRFLSWWAGPFFSPMGVVPHQSLLALLVLCAVSGRSTPRPLMFTAVACAFVLAAADLALTSQPWAILLPTAALAALVTSLVDFQRIGSFKGDSRPDPGESRPPTRKSTPAEKSGEPAPSPPKGGKKKAGRKWDLR